MARRILLVILVLVLLVVVYVAYKDWKANNALNSGNVYSDNITPGPSSATGPTSTTNTPAQTTTYSTNGTVQQPAPTQQPQPVTAPPLTDTVAPNPPNGLAFGGTGRYQWYRQGNLTWRIDTQSGQACIMFATDEEWRKPRVYQHGCGSS